MTHVDSQSFFSILGCIELLNHEYIVKKPGYSIMLKSYFTQLIVFLSRYYSENFLERNTVWYFSKVLSYIEVNYIETIKIEELAYMCHLSRRQFQRSFKDYFQVTPYEYILNKRMEKAYYLLKESTLSITEIALSCDFGDSNYFSRLFKNRTSKTPNEFRLHS